MQTIVIPRYAGHIPGIGTNVVGQTFMRAVHDNLRGGSRAISKRHQVAVSDWNAEDRWRQGAQTARVMSHSFAGEEPLQGNEQYRTIQEASYTPKHLSYDFLSTPRQTIHRRSARTKQVLQDHRRVSYVSTTAAAF